MGGFPRVGDGLAEPWGPGWGEGRGKGKGDRAQGPNERTLYDFCPEGAREPWRVVSSRGMLWSGYKEDQSGKYGE